MYSLSNREVENSFDVMEDGIYNSFIDKVEVKTSKAGASYINVRHRLFGEKYANRVVFNMFNVNHPKEQVKRIAFDTLATMFRAAGFSETEMNFQNEAELLAALGKVRVAVNVKTQKSDGYDDKNVIKGFYKLSDDDGSETVIDSSSIPF